MRGKRFSIGLRAALAILAVTLSVTSTWAATNWKEKVLYNFNNNGTDGYYPLAGLIFDGSGNLYGTTSDGGTGIEQWGTVFELTPAGTETVLYNFCSQPNCADGNTPYTGLIFDAAGNLYGTTSEGGTGCYPVGCGAVFQLTPTGGGGWTEAVLHSFNHTDGEEPWGLIFDTAGNLYGTTDTGGGSGCNNVGCGTLFELTPDGSGGWTATVLYYFCSQTNCPDGAWPNAGLIIDAAGNLYGTTSAGGTGCNPYGCGTVFKLSPTEGGGWTETVLHRFGGGTDGLGPSAVVIFDAAGNLYGTTEGGGAYNNGTAFELTPTAGAGWSTKILHSFGSGTDGAAPYSGLIFDAAGNLYGTTENGGTSDSCHGGCGTVFELTPTTGGGWTETVLHSFGSGTDGVEPYSGLIFDAAGNLYGTTPTGGAYGYGTVFELTPVYPCATCSHAVGQ